MSQPLAQADLGALSPDERRQLLARLLSRRSDQEQSYPLSFAQQRLWFLDRLHPLSPAYNIPGAFLLEGALDVAALAAALGDVVQRHATLRTTFTEEAGRPRQTVRPVSDIRLPVTDVAGATLDDRKGAARHLVDAEVALPFDLSTGPVFRASLLRLDAECHVLVVVIHHISADGWSLGLFNRDLAAAYRARLSGSPSPFGPLASDYIRFSAWQKADLAGDKLSRLLTFWTNTLAGLPALDLPVDRPRPALARQRGDSLDISLSAPLVAAATAFARAQGTTLYCVLLAAFHVVLGRLSAQSDFAIGTPVANRGRLDVEDQIGFFVNTLPMRIDTSRAGSFAAVVDIVTAASRAAQQHQDLPFEKLVEDLNVPRDTSRNPLVQVLFALQNAPMQPLQLDSLAITPFPYTLAATRFDLELHLWDGRQTWTGARDTEAGLTGSIFYNSDLFEPATVAGMADMVATLLAAALAAPNGALADLPLLSDQALRRVLAAGQGPDIAPASVPDLLRQARAAFASQPAHVEAKGEAVTYAALFERAERLAAALKLSGVGPGAVVALLMPRGRDLVTAMLAASLGGLTFAPIDPRQPAARIAQQLRLAGARFVLHEARHADVAAAQPVPGATVEALLGGADGAIAEAEPPETAPLYIVFTSGSTGTPKGVVMSRRGFANLMAAQVRTHPEPKRTLQASAVGFDVAIQEVLFTLITGGTLVTATDDDRLDPHRLADLIDREGVERAFLPYALVNLLVGGLDGSQRVLASLGEIITAGEQPRLTAQARQVFARHRGLRLINQYGPAEAHVVSEMVLDGDPMGWPDLPAAGRPVAGNRLHVLDAKGQPVPFGVAGELHIGGAQVADGYAGLAAETAERFRPDPFSDEPEARLYRTGDLATFDHAGLLHLLGRTDSQVKIRGYRVEPAEIEILLASHPQVAACAVIAEATGLSAFIVPKGTMPTASALRDWLRPQLPDYMIPARFAAVDAIPLSANGKVDAAALSARSQPLVQATAHRRLPQSETERLIATIWCKVLQQASVDCETTFFDLGGNSLLIVEVCERLRQAVDPAPSLSDLFQFPTIEALARHVASLRAAPAGVRAAATIMGRAQRMRGGSSS
ncbi:amino acid adenylation domain-containing protein [Phreatobacter aquaticus]|uniref:Amino acid adenylation domain-containing protein n=1 Tax=Phreatobacter aquaticus TaxID=2570229 RepID=A0A4D7QD79_9HYPH|nr:non-ribosomal peptide synthetase [Phreatobacter aquaticus]QCK84371.1 amino acid adenylation domain-containing protein [Phreatobacter aquaticus]